MVLCKGSKVPLVVRGVKGEERTWRLVGDAYVHGIMRGEAFEEWKCGKMLLVSSIVRTLIWKDFGLGGSSQRK